MEESMERVAVFGAGGKMGFRIVGKLRDAGYTLFCVENGPDGQTRLTDAGFDLTDADEALKQTQTIVLALPDRLIGNVLASIDADIPTDTLVVCLDPAAPQAGKLGTRSDIAYFVTHPCHPSVFKNESDPDARKDFFGGVARQSIVCALMQGSESDYEKGEQLARHMFSPIDQAHRITVDQMAILEPALSETVSITLLSAIKEAMDEAIARGVPEAAARDFIIGHIGVELSIIFGHIDARLSDGALMAARRAATQILTPDWKKVFQPENIMTEIREITGGA
jgi:D-apionate oxidoisomerase